MVDQIWAESRETRVKSGSSPSAMKCASGGCGRPTLKDHNFVENGSFWANATAIEPQEPIKTICKNILTHLRGLMDVSDGNLQILPKPRCLACAGGAGRGGFGRGNQFWPFSLQNEGR